MRAGCHVARDDAKSSGGQLGCAVEKDGSSASAACAPRFHLDARPLPGEELNYRKPAVQHIDDGLAEA
jgi:hypothetical protein